MTGRAYVTSEQIVPVEEVYYDAEAKPAGDGPWLGEADKIAWRDEASGYDCIMLRNTRRGFLSGYVGIPGVHPLWGWDHDAMPPDLGIDVHGGLTYSRICQGGPSPERRIVAEARRICHVPRTLQEYEPTTHASDYRADDARAWWFGFSCDHAYDVVPADSGKGGGFLKAEVRPQYRNDAYVVRNHRSRSPAARDCRRRTCAAARRYVAARDRARPAEGTVIDPRHRFVGDLPWGWWLRASNGYLEDDDGGTWDSVREAYWQPTGCRGRGTGATGRSNRCSTGICVSSATKTSRGQ